MKKIKLLIFGYLIWKLFQDINGNPRLLKFLEGHREAMVDLGAKRIERLIYGKNTKRSRKMDYRRRHAS